VLKSASADVFIVVNDFFRGGSEALMIFIDGVHCHVRI